MLTCDQILPGSTEGLLQSLSQTPSPVSPTPPSVRAGEWFSSPMHSTQGGSTSVSVMDSAPHFVTAARCHSTGLTRMTFSREIWATSQTKPMTTAQHPPRARPASRASAAVLRRNVGARNSLSLGGVGLVNVWETLRLRVGTATSPLKSSDPSDQRAAPSPPCWGRGPRWRPRRPGEAGAWTPGRWPMSPLTPHR